MDPTQLVSSFAGFLSPASMFSAAEIYPAAFDFLAGSNLLPTAHSDNHFDGNGNHTVFSGTSTDFVLDIGLGPAGEAMAGENAHYDLHLGPSGPTFSTSYSGTEAMTTTVAVDLWGNGFIQSEFVDPVDGSTSALILPVVGFNRQDPIITHTPILSAEPLVTLDGLTASGWLF